MKFATPVLLLLSWIGIAKGQTCLGLCRKECPPTECEWFRGDCVPLPPTTTTTTVATTTVATTIPLTTTAATTTIPITTAATTTLATTTAVPPPYLIDLDYSGVPLADLTIFTGASQKWTRAITADVPDFSNTDGLSASYACDNGYPSAIDDLYICGRYTNIDGTGGVLGSAGPIYIRTSNGLPITGRMQFDNAIGGPLTMSSSMKWDIFWESVLCGTIKI